MAFSRLELPTSDLIGGDLPLIYIDNHLLCLYKPAGMLVQGDKSGDVCLLDLGKEWLKERFNKAGRTFLGLVHRLDRPVAGVVVFARTSKAARRLSNQFRNRTVVKEYLGIVRGNPKYDEMSLTNHLEQRGRDCVRIVPHRTAFSKEAQLTYRVLDKKDGKALLHIILKTGRKHQIRAQLAHLGHPIVGDTRYGDITALSYGQLALIGWRITIEHPTRREPLTLQSPIPKGWPWLSRGLQSQGPLWNWMEIWKRFLNNYGQVD